MFIDRFTKKSNSLLKEIEYQLIDEKENFVTNEGIKKIPVMATNKLGKLEDIMEEFNIDSAEELRSLLETLSDSIIKTTDYDCETETFYSEDLDIHLYHDEENYQLVKKTLWNRREKRINRRDR